MAPIKSLEHFRVKPRWLFLKITDEDGQYGWGEATLEGHTRAVEGTLDDYRERLIGEEADNIEFIWQKMHRRGFYRGGPVFMSALSGVDIALWDLKGSDVVYISMSSSTDIAKRRNSASPSGNCWGAKFETRSRCTHGSVVTHPQTLALLLALV